MICMYRIEEKSPFLPSCRARLSLGVGRRRSAGRGCVLLRFLLGRVVIGLGLGLGLGRRTLFFFRGRFRLLRRAAACARPAREFGPWQWQKRAGQAAGGKTCGNPTHRWFSAAYFSLAAPACVSAACRGFWPSCPQLPGSRACGVRQIWPG